ncbi:unnamed protein product, partial [Amoebophrya sp. A120]
QCESCDAGFHLERRNVDSSSPVTGTASGTALLLQEGSSAQDGISSATNAESICTPNICTCEQGDKAAVGKQCLAHNEHRCDKTVTCNAGHYFDARTETCAPATCACPGGEPADSKECVEIWAQSFAIGGGNFSGGDRS